MFSFVVKFGNRLFEVFSDVVVEWLYDGLTMNILRFESHVHIIIWVLFSINYDP